MTAKPTIHIAAGGNGTRMKDGMDHLGFASGFPKHLLPTGNGNETLLGRIIRQAQDIGHVAVYANYDNVRHVGESADISPDISLLIARGFNGPLSALVKDIQRTNDRTFSAAGDFWANFSWKDFSHFHENHDRPVSILVGPSVPTADGARFDVGRDGTVNSWERVDTTTEQDLINIGAYIVDPEKLVMRKLKDLAWHKEDPFNDTMIGDGLMSAYVLDTPAYNVNNPTVYSALIQDVQSRSNSTS